MTNGTIGLFAGLAAAGLLSACAVADDELVRGTDTDELMRASTDLGSVDPEFSESQHGCSFQRTRGVYGFQCTGSLNMGQGLVPATLVGVVTGDGRGGFAGRGTANSPLGSLPQRLSGRATQDAGCFGRVTYDVNQLEVPPGSGNWIDLPPLVIDFAVVNGGGEILGAPISLAGNGDDVPRLTCRLVKVRSHL